MRNFSSEVAAALKAYVYVCSDPANGVPLYMARGKGDRVLAHLADKSEQQKTTACEKGPARLALAKGSVG